jgi:Flp pilus assembly protein TadG
VSRFARFKIFRKLRDDEGGAVLIQFAAMIVGMMMVFLGGFECAQYVLSYQKAERVASSIADLVGQQNTGTINSSQLNDMLRAADQIAAPFDFENNGQVIITQVFGQSAGTNFGWRVCYGDGEGDSNVDQSGSTVTLPNNFTVPAGQAALVAEVILTYEPLIFTPMFQHVFERGALIRHTSLVLNRETPPSEINVDDGNDPQC